MPKTIQIPTLSDYITEATATRNATPEKENTVKNNNPVVKIKTNRKNEDGTFQEANGRYLETFTFGPVKLHMYRNLDADRFDVFTQKGYPLSHSAKSVEAARYGAREEIKKIQRRTKYRANNRAA